MVMYIYWIIGVICEFIVMMDDIKNGKSHTSISLFIVGLINILFWPIEILLGIIIGIIIGIIKYRKSR